MTRMEKVKKIITENENFTVSSGEIIVNEINGNEFEFSEYAVNQMRVKNFVDRYYSFLLWLEQEKEYNKKFLEEERKILAD